MSADQIGTVTAEGDDLRATLWCVHVRGPDDVVPVPSYEDAVRMSEGLNWLSVRLSFEMGDDDVWTYATPMLWEDAPEQHAALVAKLGTRGYDYGLPTEDQVDQQRRKALAHRAANSPATIAAETGAGQVTEAMVEAGARHTAAEEARARYPGALELVLRETERTWPRFRHEIRLLLEAALAARQPERGELTISGYPDPEPWMLSDPSFEAIWSVIKGWDVGRGDGLYMGATGNHARAIMDALATPASAEKAEPETCSQCDGFGWVCENHNRRPWSGTSAREDACGCGAGEPCPKCSEHLRNPPQPIKSQLLVRWPRGAWIPASRKGLSLFELVDLGYEVRSFPIELQLAETERATVAIREGAFYRRGDGSKVGPMFRLKGDGVWYQRCGKGDWFDNGEAAHGLPRNHPNARDWDLVAEWVEDAAPSDQSEAVRGGDDLIPDDYTAMTAAENQLVYLAVEFCHGDNGEPLTAKTAGSMIEFQLRERADEAFTEKTRADQAEAKLAPVREADDPKIAPLPWTGKVEEVPLGGECDDVDLPFVIRDARGAVVVSLYERYGMDQKPAHEIVGRRIVAALTCLGASA